MILKWTLTPLLTGIFLVGAAAPAETVWLDQLDLSVASQGWGEPQKDKSVDGHALTIGGQSFNRGFGTHAESLLMIKLDGGGKTFSAAVGVDDEVGKSQAASVDFIVIGDGKELWRSGVMRAGDAAKPFSVNVTGVRLLTLKAGDAGDAAPPKYGHSGTFAGTYVEATSTDSSSSTAGANYMVFAGLTNDVIVIHEAMQGWQGALNGFQIVPIYPASVAVGVHFVSAGGIGADGSQYGASSPDTLAPTDSAGAPGYAQANWNNMGRWGDTFGGWFGTGVVLTNGIGAATTSLKITWNSTGCGGAAAALDLGTADGKLMDGFIYTYDGSTPNLLTNNGPVYSNTSANQLPAISINGLSSWLAGIPRAVGYNVVLYFSAAAYGPNIKGYVNAATGDPWSGTLTEVGAAAPPKFGKAGTFAGTYVEATSTNSSSVTAANYMVFAGLTNDVIVIHEAMQGWQGALNSFQIIPTFVSSASTLPLASTNALLASLSLTPAGTLVPTFASGTTGYNATNAYVNNPVTVAAVSAEAHATLALNLNGGGYGAAVTNSLSVGGNTLVLPTNTVLVRVVSQDLSQTNLYTVNVLLQPSLTVPKLTNSVSGKNLMLAWPSDHLGYRLLVQTNNLQNGVSANTNDWGTLAGSQTITTTNITVQTTNLNEFYRLVYP